MQNAGDSALKADVVASIEHALADRPGDWRVLITPMAKKMAGDIPPKLTEAEQDLV